MVAPSGVETDKDAMTDSETPSGIPDARSASGGESTLGGKAKSRTGSRSGRTPPTIDATAQDVTQDVLPTVAAEPGSAADDTLAPAPGAEVPPESVLPTEALPQEFAGATRAGPARDEPPADTAPLPEPARSRLPALALAGLAGGVVGAGLVMLAMSRATPAVTPEQVAQLQSRVEALQSAATELDRKAGAASDAAAKAGAAAQAATARVNEVAAAQAPEPGAIAGLNAQAQRAEAAASAVGQQLERATARIGTVETLAKAAAAPSPQALAAARIVLAERVQSSLASGQPFANDVAALAKGGGAPEQLAALNAVAASGAPTRDALLSQLRTHRAMFAREIMPASAGWQERLLGLASRIVSIRPVGETGANDPGTLPIRLENAIAKGDIIAASALWGQLPEPARRASADFGGALQKRAAADAAIAKIAQDAMAALGVAG
jgi:hypothetical protein